MQVFPVQTRRISVADDLAVRLDEQGHGRPVMVIHGAGGPQSIAGFVEKLAAAARAHVLAPTHPGFEGEPRPEWFTGVDDLAFTYLNLLEQLDLRDVILIGFSFGGWIASEMVVRNSSRLSGLVLVDAAGIQVEGHEIADIFSRPPTPRPEATTGNAEEAARRAANFQTLAVYGQKQGLSDPKLRRRLASVKIPALVVWGENDRIVTPDYGRAYAESFPHARFELIPNAGHFPQNEQPERFFNLVEGFMNSIPGVSSTQS